MPIKSRFTGEERRISEKISKICGKSFDAECLLIRCTLGGGLYGEYFVDRVDRLGLWNNRLFCFYQALNKSSVAEFISYVISLYPDEAMQSKIISCKTTDDFKNLASELEKHFGGEVRRITMPV